MATHKKKTADKAWVVAVDMGYGHQRPAASLQHLAYKGEVVSANNYKGIPSYDRKVWHESRKFYEYISNFKRVPVIGEKVYQFYNTLQEIPSFYPKRDLSKPTYQVKAMYSLIRKKNWGRHLIEKLGESPRPLIATFFTPAFMADAFSYPGPIYCLCTDADISRAWVSDHPVHSRINYLAPTYRVAERLKLYGVAPKQIFQTGFPLPLENLGNANFNVLKKDMLHRLRNLDPDNRYHSRYKQVIKRHLGTSTLPRKSNHPLTITFAVGGAGAQRDIGAAAIHSLRKLIDKGELRMILVAGTHRPVTNYFKKAAMDAGLRQQLGKGIQILFEKSKEDYFKSFNKILHTTDILWTKPSELSFYTALGIPMVMAPPIGSQEFFNRTWMRTIGVSVSQYSPEHADEWLMDWVRSGWFAEAAMQGFVEAPQYGTYNIEQLIAGHPEKMRPIDTVVQF